MKKRRSTVAVVDGDESILDAITWVLDNQSWAVSTYSQGEPFLADLNRYKPNCVVLDPHLPDLDGVEVVRALTVGHAAIPFIILTAVPDSPVISEIKVIGAREVLTKPVSAEVLVDHIQAMLTSPH